MQKEYISLGLMSGTSGDGVDASLIRSDGITNYEVLKDRYFEYDKDIFDDIHKLKEKIFKKKDLNTYSKEILELERKITLFHSKATSYFNHKYKNLIIGFHGQTIFHNPTEKISYQLGDGNLLSQLTKNKVVFNFRENDIINGGEGAPLTPIFHQLIASKIKIELPVCFLNIGGISNVTIINDTLNFSKIFSQDIGPGNCLIDSWVRKNSENKFDKNGQLAISGKKNEIILEQAQELFSNRPNKNKRSLDTNDFDVSFARGLNLEDGSATLTEFTAGIIGDGLNVLFENFDNQIKNIFLCGGGRKNDFLIKKIKSYLSKDINIQLIDKFKIDGDFIESQAFAFLAIRTLKNLPISFPNTTGCKKPCIGGKIIES